MSKLEWGKNFLINFHKWIQKQWLIVAIMMYTSSIWFSLIISFFGEDLHLVMRNDKGQACFTAVGIMLTVGICLFSLLMIVSQRYYEYTVINSNTEKRKLIVLETVDVETNHLCEAKFITLKKKIWNLKNGYDDNIPLIVSEPKEQIKHIIEKMNNCLSKLLSQQEYEIKKDELYISLYYNYTLENNSWKQADSFSAEKGLSIDELKNPNTTFACLQNSKKSSLFFNSKEQARKQDCYVSDNFDRVDENNQL